jgi:hypothetical protein
MSRDLYYNYSSYDSNSGAGYGLARRKFHGERPYGSNHYPYSFEDDEDEDEEIDTFVKSVNVAKLNRKIPQYFMGDPSNRADRGSLTKGYGLSESDFPKASDTISPFSSRVLYPSGFDGGAIGTGGSDQAFRTTGNFRRTGTQYGSSRAPMPIEDDGIRMYNIRDILSKEDREIIKQQVKVLKVINKLNA